MAETKVTPNEMNVDAETATVESDQTTTSTSYTDLSTPGPSVTVNIGASGTALVSIGCGMYTAAAVKQAVVDISGATTRAAASAPNAIALRHDVATFSQKQSLTYLETGLNRGSTTFTLKYRTNSGTANFFDRTITVVPL